ncbi:MAG: hypothetical protein IKZ92_04755 [Muribaculaceae bacterium]|nr:hypothetical protein [Muribaculaceae bacterium]
MKKLALTIAIVLTMGLSSFAQDGGLLNRGVSFDKHGRGDEGGVIGTPPVLPGHDAEGDQQAPLGSGVAVLLGLGAAYLIGKKREED